MLIKLSLLTVVLLLSANSVFAQDDEMSMSTLLRRQAMDKEVAKLMALRHQAIDETVNGLSGKKTKPQFFFTLLGLATKLLALKPITL